MLNHTKSRIIIAFGLPLLLGALFLTSCGRATASLEEKSMNSSSSDTSLVPENTNTDSSEAITSASTEPTQVNSEINSLPDTGSSEIPISQNDGEIEGFSMSDKIEIKVGQVYQLSACIYPTGVNNTERDKVKVIISDESVVKALSPFSGNGVVIEGLSAGECKLTVRAANGVEGTCTITVK